MKKDKRIRPKKRLAEFKASSHLFSCATSSESSLNVLECTIKQLHEQPKISTSMSSKPAEQKEEKKRVFKNNLIFPTVTTEREYPRCVKIKMSTICLQKGITAWGCCCVYEIKIKTYTTI